MFDEGDLVFSYTRKQAIDDGVLIDITEIAKHYGFIVPVAMNVSTYHECFMDDGELDEEMLRDYLCLLLMNINLGRFADGRKDLVEIFFEGKRKQRFKIWNHVGPGDEGEAVMTICFPQDF